MQVHPGVFVSSTSTEEWRPDPEIGGGAEEHVLIDTGAMRAGLSRFASDADPQPPPWVLPQTQILLVLEGGARIDIEGGPTLDLGAGGHGLAAQGSGDPVASHAAVQGDVGAHISDSVGWRRAVAVPHRLNVQRTDNRRGSTARSR